MIARTWHGVTPASKADAYYDYLEASGVKEYRTTTGNRGVFVLRRVSGDRADFLLVSLWDSYDSIRAFAGREIGKARYFPKDREFLLEFEPSVTHYEVLAAPDGL
jgi:heme-degrading monooxygenase HmoA